MFSKYKNQTRIARIPTGEAVLGSDVDTLITVEQVATNSPADDLGLTAIQASMDFAVNSDQETDNQ